MSANTGGNRMEAAATVGSGTVLKVLTFAFGVFFKSDFSFEVMIDV